MHADTLSTIPYVREKWFKNEKDGEGGFVYLNGSTLFKEQTRLSALSGD
jgi:hypothetical protein